MQFLSNQTVEKHFPRKETVLLKFDKRDSAIAREWSKAHAKDDAEDKD